MIYTELLQQVQRDYQSGDFSVSYQDIADAAGCSRMNVYFVMKGRHKNADVLLAAAKLFTAKKTALKDAAAAIAAA